MHPTIKEIQEVVAKGDKDAIGPLLADDVKFMLPTYWKTVMGEGNDWALEFQCKVGELDAVGVDLITLDDSGRIATFEVVMRPHKSVGALRDAMNARVMRDPAFLKFKEALS